MIDSINVEPYQKVSEDNQDLNESVKSEKIKTIYDAV